MGMKPTTASTPSTVPLGALPGAAHPYALQLPGQFQKAASVIKPSELLGQSQEQISRTLAGDFANIDRNPALRGILEGLQGEMARRGGMERALLRESFGRMGPAFSLDSTKAQMELERDLSNRTAQHAAQLLAPIYESERGRQYTAAGGAAELGQLPFTGMQNILRTLAGTAGGQQTAAGPSKFQQTTGAAADLIGARAPMASGGA